MPRTIAYRAGGFTNCGIGYTKFSQEELAEMKDRVMTENEALGYLKNSKRQKSMLGILPGSDIGNTIIKALEELKQYRAIGTLEECRTAVEKQKSMPVADKYMLSPIGGKIGKCPICLKSTLMEGDNPYCPNCGQKLKWEDEK